MQTYKTSITSSLIVFFPIILFTLLPYMIHSYRKKGKVFASDTIIYYSFAFYLLTALFMTMFPLPSKEFVAGLTTPKYNLKPFAFVFDFVENSGFTLSNPKSILTAIRHPSFYTAAFNVLLTLPFGVYLRKYFNFSFGKTLIAGFLLSLFFEITQLTGIYGIYPRPYRLFDVDDLMLNTLGTTIGYLITPAMQFALPKKGDPNTVITDFVSYPRRYISYLVDIMLFNVFTSLATELFKFSGLQLPNIIISAIVAYIYFIAIPFILQGSTFGRLLLKIKTVSQDGNPIKFSQLLIRNGIFLMFTMFSPMVSDIIGSADEGPLVMFNMAIFLLTMTFYLNMILRILRRKRTFFYEDMTGTVEIGY